MSRTAVVRFALALTFAASAASAQGVTEPASNASDSLQALPPTPAVTAPAPAPTNPVPAIVQPAVVPSPSTPMPARPRVVSPRPEVTIRMERDQMKLQGDAADADLLTARRSAAEAKGIVEIKKRDIDAINARIKAAKQAKDDATRTSLEADRKRQEGIRDWFGRVQDAHDAAADEAQARGEYARAAVRACDLELQLVGRSGVAANDSDPNLYKLEQQFLESVKLRGVSEEKYATRTQTLCDRRLRLYRAWTEYLTGK